MSDRRSIADELQRMRVRYRAACLRLFKRPSALDEDGGALVEFSLLAPLFFLILYGIIEFGSIFWVQNNMVNAARETARTVAVQGLTTSASLKSNVCPWLQGRNYTVQYIDQCPTQPDILATVTTDAVGASVFNYMGLFGGNLSSQVTMRRENACGTTPLATVTFTCP